MNYEINMTSNQVVSELDTRVFPDHCLSFMSRTWQASYVQLNLVMFNHDVKPSQALAFILNVNSINQDNTVKDWLVNTNLTTKTNAELHKHILFAKGEIEESITDYSDPNIKLMLSLLNNLSFDDLKGVYSINHNFKPLITPCTPDENGVNYQMFWWNETELYYLLIHLES